VIECFEMPRFGIEVPSFELEGYHCVLVVTVRQSETNDKGVTTVQNHGVQQIQPFVEGV
jgi:hypothetical protein